MASPRAAHPRPHSAPAAFASERQAARADLTAGLSQSQARVSPKYFYDLLGSKLFEAICLLDEYYPTRVEARIVADNADAIRAAVGTGVTLIDLGAGNCAKAARLFPILAPRQYAPVDISAAFLRDAVAKLQAEHKHISMHPVGLDFSESLALPGLVGMANRLFFYPGSSIGNFAPLQAAQMLGRMRAAAGPDGAVLIGVDLVKDHAVLQAAYDDALGVTAAFNLNALRHINTLLGSDFNVRDWQHGALFNAEQSRIEMHLQARRAVTVRWPGGSRAFAEGERIHTENSYKYTERSFLDLLRQSGFGDATCWTDADNAFLVCHARAS